MGNDTVSRLMVRWGLAADGAAFATHSSTLVPVRHTGMLAMLKLARTLEEARGGRLMAHWAGQGGAPVLRRHGPALLLARASGGDLAAAPDEVATPIIVAVATQLHAVAPGPRPVPLRRWFRALLTAEHRELREAATLARMLLDNPCDEAVLHGDLHHANVLDFGPRGWLAIDPKGLFGERGFEFAALLRNPTAERALAAGRLEREVARIAALTGIEGERLLGWVAATAALSAAWSVNDADLALMRLALAARR